MSITFWPDIQPVVGGTSGSPASIASDGQWTIAVVSSSDPSHAYAELPTGADIGDVVEVHYADDNVSVSAPSGESLVGGGPLNTPRVFRKISSTLWSYFR